MKVNEDNWFRRMTKWIPTPFRKKSKDSHDENDEFYNETMQRIGQWNEKLHDKHKILNEIAEDGKNIQKIGKIDGERGQNPAAMKRVVKHVSTLWQSFIESTFKEDLAQANKKKEELNSRKSALSDEIERLTTHQKSIYTHYNLNSKQYNVVLGVIYIAISIILIVADLPLSIDVVREGFQIIDGDDNVFGFIATDSQVLAWGIVLMTIYFKIFYDHYIGTTLQNSVLKKRPELALGEGYCATDEEIKQIKKLERRKFYSKLGILTILVCTLITMGFFRSEFKKITPSSSTSISGLAEELENLENKPLNPLEEIAPNSIINDTTRIHNLENSMDTEKNPYYDLFNHPSATILFVLLSIIFPVISGICASLGVNALHNSWDKGRIKRKLENLTERNDRIVKEINFTESTITSLESNLEWVDKTGNFIDDCSDYFFSYYLHGFEWGFRRKMPDSFYGVSDHIRTQHAKIQSTSLFYREMEKCTDNMHLHKLFFGKNLN